MTGVSAPITFIREIEGSMRDLIVPEKFVKDFHFSTDEHLMVMLRVTGPDLAKVRDFFEDSEGQQFTVKTIESAQEKQVSDEFMLNSIYMDEGPPLSVDIDIEPAMVRAILDFQRK